jgi:catechol 2,3-dioxygenase-like lactoylglutathione lyase family enzyme
VGARPEEAKEFYTERLGFEVRQDNTLPEFENYRWLTVGPPGQPDVSIILSYPARRPSTPRAPNFS